MELSVKDRLILSNQYKILASLASEKDVKKKYETYQIVVERGYTTQYSSLIEPIIEAGDDGKNFEFVIDVLKMFRALHDFKVKNPSEADIAKNPDTCFGGFDDKEPGGHGSIADFIHVNLGDYSESYSEGLQSHGSILSHYARMLRTWTEQGRPFVLSASQARSLIGK